MDPNFNMKPIGLSTDRNFLRKLLHFVSGRVPESWRIDVDIIEETMFFTRWEEVRARARATTGPQDSGYGYEFEKAFLSFDPSLQESSGHHRIVRYNLGGIECLVRFEVDGYVDDALCADNQTSIVHELGQGLSGLCVQNSMDLFASSSATEVRVVEKGRLVDNNSILELKSRSTSKNLRNIMPQVWISQTNHLFIGWHNNGLVKEEPERLNMEEYFPDWESKNQKHLGALVELITEIKEVVKRAKEGSCMLICKVEEKPRVLRVYEKNGESINLPKGARAKCWGA